MSLALGDEGKDYRRFVEFWKDGRNLPPSLPRTILRRELGDLGGLPVTKKLARTACFLCISTLAFGAEPPKEAERYWPQWRGPHATGVSPHGSPPVEWNEEKNVQWKVRIPGRGKSTPVIWGDRLYLTTAIPTDKSVSPDSVAQPRGHGGFHHPAVSPATRYYQFVILAIDRATGKTVWQRTVREDLPHEGTHEYGTFASMSAITDGERVYAFFGSRGLYCFDTEGKLLWEKDLGDMIIRLGFGEGASPVLHEDKIVVSWDHEGESFILALNRETGEELWRTERNEITSWATPLVVEHDGGAQVVTSATRRVRSYDLATGKLIWESAGMTLNTIPSPVAADGMVYVTSGFRGNALLAIRLSAARGDITDSDAIVWKHDRDTPYVPSPLLYEDTLYFIKRNSNVLSALDAKTGQQYFRRRLEGLNNVFASPVGADGRVYVTSREGTTAVIKSGHQPEVLATNTLDDGFDASMAIADSEIYLRGGQYLYRISEEVSPSPRSSP
ncbi:MAG: PQQ-binding-like beta-propeller repeat protein [Acidobacteriota bacterium]